MEGDGGRCPPRPCRRDPAVWAVVVRAVGSRPRGPCGGLQRDCRELSLVGRRCLADDDLEGALLVRSLEESLHGRVAPVREDHLVRVDVLDRLQRVESGTFGGARPAPARAGTWCAVQRAVQCAALCTRLCNFETQDRACTPRARRVPMHGVCAPSVACSAIAADTDESSSMTSLSTSRIGALRTFAGCCE